MKCKFCNKSFEKKYETQKFCSLKCANNLSSIRFASTMSSSCKYCKTEFRRQYKAQAYCSLRCANKLNWKNQCHEVVLPLKYSEDLAEMVGILLGDGHVSKYYAKVFLNRKADKYYVPYVIDLAKSLFPKASVTCQDTSQTFHRKGLAEIQISSTRHSYKNIYLSNKENIFRYVNEIGSHNPKIVNQINIYKMDSFVY